MTRRAALGGLAAASAYGAAPRLPVAIMSKFLQFMDVPEMARRAKELGFDGIDLCVRPGAHVLPERVEQDLPAACEIIRKAGLEVPMLTAAIVDARSPHAESMLRTASALGIRYYRWGGFSYKPGVPIPQQIEELRPRTKELADLNREYNMCAMYHTHSGLGQVGASIWDLWLLLRDMDARYVAINYDIGHATVEGGYGGWINTFNLTSSHIKGVAMKDFKWGQNAKGEWIPRWSPLGEGMVNFKRYLPMLKAIGFNGPVQLHFEFPLGGVDTGQRKISIPQETAYAAMRKDLTLLRSWFADAGI